MFSSYLIFILPVLILSMYAQNKVSSAYAKYQKVTTRSHLTGYEVAQRILRGAGITDVQVEMTEGQLTDHYDPRKNVVRLSAGVYNGSSVAAFGIAAHEIGHVMQYHEGYSAIKLRNAIVPVVSFSSTAAMPLFVIGFFMNSGIMIDIGIALFAGVVIFHLITLPVEFNASSRAVAVLQSENLVLPDEALGVKEVLNAAALTYVASALMALMQLVRLLFLRGSRR